MSSWQRKPQSAAIILICAVGFIIAFALGRYTNEVREVSAPIETTETIQDKVRPVIRQEIERSRDETPAWVPRVERPLRERLLVWKDASRGGNWIARLDARLAGTPLAGRGREFYMAAVDNGLPPTLSYAIAHHESGGFMATPPGSNNFYGMKYGNPWLLDQGYSWGKGPDGRFKYQRFNSVAAGIYSHASYIRRTWGFVDSPYQMRGYAESGAWADAVEAERRRV